MGLLSVPVLVAVNWNITALLNSTQFDLCLQNYGTHLRSCSELVNFGDIQLRLRYAPVSLFEELSVTLKYRSMHLDIKHILVTVGLDRGMCTLVNAFYIFIIAIVIKRLLKSGGGST